MQNDAVWYHLGKFFKSHKSYLYMHTHITIDLKNINYFIRKSLLLKRGTSVLAVFTDNALPY